MLLRVCYVVYGTAITYSAMRAMCYVQYCPTAPSYATCSTTYYGHAPLCAVLRQGIWWYQQSWQGFWT
eukprot:2802711-Rhodomonas_salina.5